MAARSPRPFVVRLTELLLNRVTAVTPRVRAFMKRLSMHRSLQPLCAAGCLLHRTLSLRRRSRLRAKHLRETAAAHHRPHRLCQPRHPGWLASSRAPSPPTTSAPSPATLQLHGISLLFSRSAAQQTALDTLVAAQQNPASPLYHQWITPDQYAAQFGVAGL